MYFLFLESFSQQLAKFFKSSWLFCFPIFICFYELLFLSVLRLGSLAILLMLFSLRPCFPSTICLFSFNSVLCESWWLQVISFSREDVPLLLPSVSVPSKFGPAGAVECFLDTWSHGLSPLICGVRVIFVYQGHLLCFHQGRCGRPQPGSL